MIIAEIRASKDSDGHCSSKIEQIIALIIGQINSNEIVLMLFEFMALYKM